MRRNYWMIIVISIATAIGLNNILLWINLSQYSEAYQETAQRLYSPTLVEQILTTGILIPIIEEILFRGLVFGLIRKRLSFVWAMSISSVLFGVYHGNLVQFVYATICGILLTYFYEKFGSVAAPILAHMMMNLTAVILTNAGVFTWMFLNLKWMAAITILCVVLTCVLLANIHKMDVTKMLKKYCKPFGDSI